jgi:hypothetical protein
MGFLDFLTKATKTERDIPNKLLREVARRLQAIFPEISWHSLDLDTAIGTITDPAGKHGGLCGLKVEHSGMEESLLFHRTILNWPPPENEQIAKTFLDTTSLFLLRTVGAAIIATKATPAVMFHTIIAKGIVGYTDEKLRTLVELNYCLGDVVKDIAISVCRKEMQPSEAASAVAAELGTIMESRSWMIGDTPVGSKRIPDDTDIIGIGRNFLVNPKKWNWVNTAAQKKFDEAQESVKRRDVMDAVSKYMAVIELEPRWCAPYYELGTLFFTANDLSRATSLLRKSIEVDPNYPPAYFNLAACYKAAGEFQAALGLLLKYVEFAPTDPEGFYAIGCIYMRTGDVQRENQAYEATLRAQSGYIPAHFNLGINRKAAGQRERARFHLQKVLELLPGPDAMDLSPEQKKMFDASARRELQQL